MKLLDTWGELYGAFLLLVGLIISIIMDAAIVSYFVIFFCGIIVGRMYSIKKKQHSALFYVITFMFLVGYLLGAIIRNRGNPIAILILFWIGCYWGNYLKKNKIIK